MNEDPFVKKNKKKRIIQENPLPWENELKNTKQLITIKDDFSDWLTEVERWYNKWTERPHKKLFI